MVNKKLHNHSSRGKFKKRALPPKEMEKANVEALPQGSRIINIKQLAALVEEISSHSCSCRKSSISLVGESNREGLASVLSAQCSGCQLKFAFPTSPKVGGVGKGKHWECNLAAVWGQMSTGGGHAKLAETMSVLGVPVMTKKSFVATEKAVGRVWRNALEESMREAAEEEKRHAIEMGSMHEGVPAISVIVDGGWSKRTHKHSYNAKSGVAVIIGMQTKKLLHLGVRNKYCSVCAHSAKHNTEPPQHDCYRNWDGPSSSMETDILVQGFIEAERKYGLRYTTFTGDGDSSVHVSLITGVPGWGHAIRKMECANHAIKCYRGALEKLVAEKPHYKGRGKLTEGMRKRLTTAARCAIKMRSTESNAKRATELLRQDLRNGPLHCFGVHTNCSTDYCKVARTGPSNATPDNCGTFQLQEVTSENLDEEEQSLYAVAAQEEQFWRDALDEKELESVRSVATQPASSVDKVLLLDIQRLVGRLIALSDKLLGKRPITKTNKQINKHTNFYIFFPQAILLPIWLKAGCISELSSMEARW